MATLSDIVAFDVNGGLAMHVVSALTTVALGASLLVGTGVAGNAGAATGSAPVPVPTHLPIDPCDGAYGPQRPCERVDNAVESRFYRCESVAGFTAEPYDSSIEGMYRWRFEGYGSHSCPRSHGDVVQMRGSVLVNFAGTLVGPFTCTDFGSCETRTGLSESWPLAGYAVTVSALTTTDERHEGVDVDELYAVYP